ncbi:type II toxin-antitoxin system VapC family toxin [Lacimicrobium alkaliphilum]|uniref:Twitching motility protein PilT n=1 Tax=Lacimicrobium alkaliphilum TaxID=1526571 RepID=A0ABQ1R455_9ALTE|nr:type II toxin-antitoxin system VapC family toxin [Lacimicrobium alkaliphilum]GGD54300.1 twitching motility protein PilT [Lacimicrobium alkaliphilum]
MIVLDTHALIWWVNGDSQLSQAPQQAIERELSVEDGMILMSSITSWEIAMLVQKERLALTMSVDDWLSTVSDINAVQFVAVDNEIGVEATRLPGEFHKDPADRMIVATARHINAPLVTADEKIRTYKYVRTIW